MARLRSVTKPKLNARGYDPDRPVPWEYTDPDTNERVHLSYRYEHQEEERLKREHRQQHALLWTKSQPSTASDEAAYQAGIGNWVIVNTEHAEQLRLFGHQVITEGAHLVKTKQHFEELQKLQFVQLPRDLDGAHERDIGIKQGLYLDLPITSVRAIRLRIHVLQRKLHQFKLALETKPAHDLVRRALKILGCGQLTKTQVVDAKTKKTITKIAIASCRTKSCGMPDCSLRNYYHKRAKYRSNIKTALQAAQQHSQHYRLLHLTITTNWALPRDETTHRAKLNPVLSTAGHKAKEIKSNLLEDNSKMPSLYQTRLHDHLTAMREALDSKPVRRVILNTPHRVTETAFLLSDKSGRRSYPNPHTHAVIAVANTTTDQELVSTLLQAVKKRIPNGNVKITDLHYGTEEDAQEQAAALGAYDAKEHALTPSGSDGSDYSQQEQQYLEALGQDWQPHSTELMACLDDRSLSEVVEAEDYDDSVLYHSDVKTLPTADRKQQVIIIKMTPLTKPLGKDKGKPTHTRRLLMFFSPRKRKVTRSQFEVTPINSDGYQIADRRVASSAVSGLDELVIDGSVIDGLGGCEPKADGFKSDKLPALVCNEVELGGCELVGVATHDQYGFGYFISPTASAMSFAAA